MEHTTTSSTVYNVNKTSNTYKTIININLNKRYIIQKYSNKQASVIQSKVRDISLDKSNWSGTVLSRITEIINDPPVIGSIRGGGSQMVFYRDTADGKMRTRGNNE